MNEAGALHRPKGNRRNGYCPECVTDVVFLLYFGPLEFGDIHFLNRAH